MITGLHTVVYSDDPPATRAFLRDVVGWPAIEPAPGWLVFATGPSEMGVHPRTWPGRGEPYDQQHELSLLCDDLDATIAELEARGASFDGGIWEQKYGRGTSLVVPGMQPIMIYEPTYEPAWS